MHNYVSNDTGYSPHTALISWESDIDVGRVPSLGLKTAAIAISTPAKECRESRLGPRHAAEPSEPGDSGGILFQVPHGRLQRKMTSPEVFPLASFHSMAAVPTSFLRPRRLLIRQSVETRSYSHHFTSHTTRKYNKINPTHERKYRITMFRVRRARRRTRGRGACAWRRPWTRTRWRRCSRPATTTATSAAPPTPARDPRPAATLAFTRKW